MRIVSVDYETFSKASLPDVGLWAYARHPSTRILCVAWAYDDAEPEAWWPGLPAPTSLLRAFKQHRLHAFNANFERAITEGVAVKLGWPAPKLAQWHCSQAVARMCALPDKLAVLAKVLKVPEQKDTEGERLIKLFSMPQPRTGQIILPKDRPDDFKKMVAYCRQDVRTERACLAAMPIQELPPFEQKVWRVDSIVNKRGVMIDRPMAVGAVKIIAKAKASSGVLLSKATNGTITSAGQRARIRAFAVACKYPLANMKKDTVTAAIADDALPGALRTVLELYDDTNISSVAKFTAMLLTADKDDHRVRDAHAYHSAAPGRWGGRIVQTQNIPRPTIRLDDWDRQMIRDGDAQALELIHGEGRVLHVLRDAIRNAIIAKPGHEFHVVDKASIEARVLGWAAGCKGYQKAFRDGRDLYIVCASGIFGKSYKDIEQGYKADVHEFVEYRKTGKDSVLALGYGQGDGTQKNSTGGFLNYCLRKGGKMTPALAIKTVRAYRRDLFPEIPDFWYETEKCALRAVRTGKRVTMGGGERPKINFDMIKGYLAIQLPSGRRLWYPEAHIKHVTNKWGAIKPELRFFTCIHRKLWVRESTYGGKLVENIVQAIARDLLAIALVKCEEAKKRPVMHVHDEIVGEVPTGHHNIDDMHAIFRTVPDWGKGLILGSGGFVTTFYRK